MSQVDQQGKCSNISCGALFPEGKIGDRCPVCGVGFIKLYPSEGQPVRHYVPPDQVPDRPKPAYSDRIK